MNTFIRHMSAEVGYTKINNKQYTNIQKREKQSIDYKALKCKRSLAEKNNRNRIFSNSACDHVSACIYRCYTSRGGEG